MADSYRILVDLDALLDTRLATLATMDVELANKVGQSLEYYNRYSDDLSLIDPNVNSNEFKDRYLKRNETILSYALMTDVLHLVCLGLQSMLDNIQRGISPRDTRVEINTAEYRLSQSQRKYIEAAVLHHIPFEVDVKLVSLGLYNLNPAYLRTNYKEWYTYNIEPWLVIHEQDILAKPSTEVQIVLPKLSTSGNDPLAESFEIDPWLARELLFKPHLSLNYVDLRFFTYNHQFSEHLIKTGFYSRSDSHVSGF